MLERKKSKKFDLPGCGTPGIGDWDGTGVAGGELRSRVLAPSEARLQFARRPLITGVASSHAFFAASASLNVTYIAAKIETKEIYYQHCI